MRPTFHTIITFLLGLILSILIAVLSVIRADAQSPQTTVFQIGKKDTLYSNILHEQRRILISLPGSAGDTYFTPLRYPVVYVLDGEEHFNYVSTIIKQLGENIAGTAFPEMIVVGIINTDRNRDLTPTRPLYNPPFDSAMLTHTGGGESFLAFIEKELIPHIDSLYPTAPYRVFIGHSLGGLTVINALIHHTNLFNAWIAVDPSMSWDQQRLLHEARKVLTNPSPTGGPIPFANRTLFLGIANSMRTDLPVSPFGVDTMMTRLSDLHYHSILTLRDYLTTAPQPAAQPSGSAIPGPHPSLLRFASKYYPDFDHSMVAYAAEYEGLRFIFNFYDLQFPFGKFFQPTFTGDNLIAIHYQDISRRMGYPVLPPEPFINNLAYNLLRNKQFDRAYQLFAMNMANYPKSFNVYDSMGDYYLAIGDKPHAITSFTQSLTLRETSDTREKLQKLQSPN